MYCTAPLVPALVAGRGINQREPSLIAPQLCSSPGTELARPGENNVIQIGNAGMARFSHFTHFHSNLA